MLPFKTSAGARFFCRTDFSQTPVLNLYFHDAGRRRVLFHLSLRHDEGVAVVNRRDGELWARELIWKLAFDRSGGGVDIRFQSGHVTVAVQDRDLGRFDRFPRPHSEGRFYLRRGFPNLRAIEHVSIGGDVQAGSLLLDSPAMRRNEAAGTLELTDRLEILQRGITPDAAEALRKARLRLQVEGMEDALPVSVVSLPYVLSPGGEAREQALRCVLPGRIWQAAGPERKIGLRLVDATIGGNGTVLAQVTLGTDAFIDRIEALARADGFGHDALAALQAIEHCRYAGLLNTLSPRTRASVAAAAVRHGLSAWLFEASVGADPGAITPVVDAAEAEEQLVERQRDHFTATMRQTPGTDPVALLRTMQAETPLTRPQRASLILRLSEWFSTHDDPRALHALALAEGHPRFARRDNAWHNSSVLPFLYCDAQAEQVHHLVSVLANSRNQWVVTPAVAWVAGEAARNGPDAQGRPIDDAARLSVVWSFLYFIETLAKDYWDRTPCHALMRAMVEILVQAETFPGELRDRAVHCALQVYGLTPGFWAIVGGRIGTDWPDPPRRIVDAQARFARLAALVGADSRDRPARAGIDEILSVFERLGTVGTDRFRRELLGPAGVVTDAQSAPEPDAILATTLDPEEAALRYLAFPRPETGRPEPAQTLLDAAQRGLADAYDRVPRAPHARLQARLGRQAVAILADGADAAVLRDFADALKPLCRAHNGYLGFGLGLSVAGGLARKGAEFGALIDRLEQIQEALTRRERDGLGAAASPAMALQVLRRDLPGHALTQRAEALFGAGGPQGSTGPTEDRAADLTARANPVFDTLVALYSCRPNLDTRIQAMRAGWLRLLEGMGVPFLVFVGDGDGRRDGDVVHLDAPDDYEGLPQKTLAMVRWVRDHTTFSYLLKIDDDCFLDPEAFFLSLSHLKFDYYGRPLHRVHGQMDRTWHMAKSRSPRGRLELDKSPEPSRYADGGSGYTLSRRAMNALIQAADSPDGQAVQQVSFMEDKLVGDLLALRNVSVSGEDYRIAVMRRTRPGGPLVSQWENGFLPFAGAGVKLAHLDGHERQAEVLERSHQPWPTPAKIWPGYQPVRLGSNSNALDLVSSPERLARVNAAAVAVVACLRNEAFMLPHFLAHYRKLGVEGFLIADNGSDDGTLDYLSEQPDVALFSVDTEYSKSKYGVAWQQALLGNFREGRWSVVADADELLFWSTDHGGSLPGLVETADFADADAARVLMLDMYPKGSLEAADFSSGDPFAEAGYCDRVPFLEVSGAMGPYTDAPIVTSALRHRLLPGSRAELFVAQKVALLKYRPWMRLSAGLHAVAETRLARRDLIFAHFKYNAAFRAKALAEVSRGQHFNNAEEYRKYLALVSEGRETIFDPAVSVAWRECDSVRRFCQEA